MTVNRDQADALATLARAIRAEAGSSIWHAAGIVASIAKVRDRSLADVSLAVLRAADDPTLDTPGAIGNPTTSCWEERKVDRRVSEPFDPATFCGICSQPELRCRRNAHADHEFVTAVEHARAAQTPKPPLPRTRALLPTPDDDTTRTETEESA